MALSDVPRAGGAAAPLLAIDSLVKDFGGLRAVNNCSFTVPKGSITGLIGPNGAGKTTVFSLISGFHAPDSGSITFDGRDITGLPSHRIFTYGLSRTFQIPREHRSMTLLENLMLVPTGQLGENPFNMLFRFGSVRSQEHRIRDKAREILEFVNLTHVENEFAGNLSGGQKKLLELARTLMADPKLILLDEPAAGVNPTLMGKIRERIIELNRDRGITFLLIEHDMPLVMGLCDPVIVMNAGTKLAEGRPELIREDPRVLEAYLGGQYAAAEG